MRKLLSLISLSLFLVGAVFFMADAEDEAVLVHVSQIDPVILEQASLINCICITGGGAAWIDYENMQPDKEGYVYVNSNGYPICLPCENEHQDPDPGN